MAKGILQFKLPEEQSEYLNAVYGSRYHGTISTVDERLRTILKHTDCSDEVRKLANEIRDILKEDLEIGNGW